jgi:protein TonB
MLAVGLFGVSLGAMCQQAPIERAGISVATCDASTQMQMSLPWPHPLADVRAARCLVQAGDNDGAMRLLRLAVDHPAFREAGAIGDEPVFAGLHGDQRWSELVAEAQLKSHLPPAHGAAVDWPSKIRNPPPAPSRPNGISYHGLVVLLVHVAPDDSVYRVDVETSSGYPVLDAAAVEAVKAWKYHAGVGGGVHFGGSIRIPIQYGRARASGVL